MAPDEGEDCVVGSIAVWFEGEDEVVDATVDCGDFTHFAEFHASLLKHGRVKHRIACLEFGGIVAAVDLARTVHHQYRHCDMIRFLHKF